MPKRPTSLPIGSESGMGVAPKIHLMRSTPIRRTAYVAMIA